MSPLKDVSGTAILILERCDGVGKTTVVVGEVEEEVEVDDGVTWELEVVGIVPPGDEVVTARPFPIVLVVAQFELAGAGCAEGVIGWPWKNVEVP